MRGPPRAEAHWHLPEDGSGARARLAGRTERDLGAHGVAGLGDIAEALNAATAIGDDRLQRQTQGRVVPESFTHGSSEERVRWFKRGMDSGCSKDCDPFSTTSP